MQAAGLINFTFSQSTCVNFVLNCQTGSGGTSLAIMNAALKVVLAARKICQQAMRFDLGCVPFLVTDTADSLGVLIYRCSVSPELAKARGQVLKVASDSNPLVAGLSLFNMLQSSTQPLEIIFTAEAAKVALQVSKEGARGGEGRERRRWAACWAEHVGRVQHAGSSFGAHDVVLDCIAVYYCIVPLNPEAASCMIHAGLSLAAPPTRGASSTHSLACGARSVPTAAACSAACACARRRCP